MKIGYCVNGNICDKKLWSGIHYYISKSLERNGQKISYFGSRYLFVEFLGRLINKIVKLLCNKKFGYEHFPLLAKQHAIILRGK